MQKEEGEDGIFKNERRKLQVDYTKKEEVVVVSSKKR